MADTSYAGRDDGVLRVVDPRRRTAELKVEALPGAPEPLSGPLELTAVVSTHPVPLTAAGHLDLGGLLPA